MLIKAAVSRHKNKPFALERVTIAPPRADEVLIRVVACGMCHTDLIVRDQVYPVPQPIVLGHEGSGVVESVGERVMKVSPGDHVVMTFLPCGMCRLCQIGMPAACEKTYALNFAGARPDGSHALQDEKGRLLHDRFFGQSSFSTYTIANERNVIKVRKDAPLELLGPLGCGVQTGAGTVLNALKVRAGSSFAAFGGGAVGLSGVMAARLAGATTIVSVDIVPSRLDLALELGATHVINSLEQDPVEAVRAICGGVDFAMDSTGIATVVTQAIAALRPKGIFAIVGASKPGTQLIADITDVMQNGKSIVGVIEGESVPDVFIPQLIELYMQGRFPFDKLVRYYPFAEINQAAADSEKGGTIKPIIVMDPPKDR
jgi:aryl-alcohol dehydrogenase